MAVLRVVRVHLGLVRRHPRRDLLGRGREGLAVVARAVADVLDAGLLALAHEGVPHLARGEDDRRADHVAHALGRDLLGLPLGELAEAAAQLLADEALERRAVDRVRLGVAKTERDARRRHTTAVHADGEPERVLAEHLLHRLLGRHDDAEPVRLFDEQHALGDAAEHHGARVGGDLRLDVADALRVHVQRVDGLEVTVGDVVAPHADGDAGLAVEARAALGLRPAELQRKDATQEDDEDEYEYGLKPRGEVLGHAGGIPRKWARTLAEPPAASNGRFRGRLSRT